MDKRGAVAKEGGNTRRQAQPESHTDYWKLDNGPRIEKRSFTK